MSVRSSKATCFLYLSELALEHLAAKEVDVSLRN